MIIFHIFSGESLGNEALIFMNSYNVTCTQFKIFVSEIKIVKLEKNFLHSNSQKKKMEKEKTSFVYIIIIEWINRALIGASNNSTIMEQMKEFKLFIELNVYTHEKVWKKKIKVI